MLNFKIKVNDIKQMGLFKILCSTKQFIRFIITVNLFKSVLGVQKGYFIDLVNIIF